jgi:hypothetical protein
MGMGAEGGASIGPEAGMSSGDVGGQGGQFAGGGGGGMAGIQAFLKDPKNVQAISEMMSSVGKFQGAANKLPPEAQKFMRDAMISGIAKGAGGAGGGGGQPGLGSLQPSGAYTGDIANYQIDPRVAQMVLSRMGIA